MNSQAIFKSCSRAGRARFCVGSRLALAVVLYGVFYSTVASEPRSANRVLPGPVAARVIQVLDGDTLIVRARIWLGQEVETKVRLTGIDTPELRAKCAQEKQRALAAKAYVTEQVASGDITLTNIHYGKFAGRVLARVQTPTGDDLTQSLITSGHGRAYGGGKRAGWRG